MKKILLIVALLIIHSVAWACENDDCKAFICSAQVIDKFFGTHNEGKPATNVDLRQAIITSFNNVHPRYTDQCEVLNHKLNNPQGQWETKHGGFACYYECTSN